MITFEELREVINTDGLHVNDEGIVVWRSGMDAGSYCPLIGKNVKGLTDIYKMVLIEREKILNKYK